MAIVISTSVSRPHTTTALDGDVVHVALVVELCLAMNHHCPNTCPYHAIGNACVSQLQITFLCFCTAIVSVTVTV